MTYCSPHLSERVLEHLNRAIISQLDEVVSIEANFLSVEAERHQHLPQNPGPLHVLAGEVDREHPAGRPGLTPCEGTEGRFRRVSRDDRSCKPARVSGCRMNGGNLEGYPGVTGAANLHNVCASEML